MKPSYAWDNFCSHLVGVLCNPLRVLAIALVEHPNTPVNIIMVVIWAQSDMVRTHHQEHLTQAEHESLPVILPRNSYF